MRKFSVIVALFMVVLPVFSDEIGKTTGATRLRQYGTLEHPEPYDDGITNIVNNTVATPNNAVDTANIPLQTADTTNSTTDNTTKIQEETLKTAENTTETSKMSEPEKIQPTAQNEQVSDKQSDKQSAYETASSSNPKVRFPHGLQFGVGVSATSGLNGFVGYNNKNFDSFWAKRFGIRFDLASYSPIKNKLNRRINDAINNKGVEIDDNLEIMNIALSGKHIGAMIDFYPFGNTWFLGGLRVSGGYMAGNLDVNSDIFGISENGKIKFELGDGKFYYDGYEMQGKAKFDWKYRGPYLGTGFDLGLFLGFKIYMDAGVVFADKTAKVDLDVPLKGLKHQSDGSAVTQSELDTAKAQALYDAQKELDKYPYYPMVKLGFMYRF